MSTFVEIPAEALLGELRAIGEAVEGRGGHYEEGVAGREIVFDLHVPAEVHPEYGQATHLTMVRIYTSISKGSSVARGCGDDAIRIVLGALIKPREYERASGSSSRQPTTGPKFRPLDKGRRIFRTAPKGEPEERVKAFLARFRQALREAYATVSKVPVCDDCREAPMAIRKTKDGKRQFYGCIRFPDCRGTRPAPGGAA